MPSSFAFSARVYSQGTNLCRNRRKSSITAQFSMGKFQGSLLKKSLMEACSRRMGENTPNCSHRVASSSSRMPSIWPPMSWLHQP